MLSDPGLVKIDPGLSRRDHVHHGPIITMAMATPNGLSRINMASLDNLSIPLSGANGMHRYKVDHMVAMTIPIYTANKADGLPQSRLSKADIIPLSQAEEKKEANPISRCLPNNSLDASWRSRTQRNHGINTPVK